MTLPKQKSTMATALQHLQTKLPSQAHSLPRLDWKAGRLVKAALTPSLAMLSQQGMVLPGSMTHQDSAPNLPHQPQKQLPSIQALTGCGTIPALHCMMVLCLQPARLYSCINYSYTLTNSLLLHA